MFHMAGHAIKFKSPACAIRIVCRVISHGRTFCPSSTGPEAPMKLTLVASLVLVALTALVARTCRNHATHPERLDPAVLAAMTAEAERIAAPLRRHVAIQLAALD